MISCVLAALSSLGPQLAAAARPNIIFIFTDDHAAGMTGFEGNPVVKTPNLNALAAESVHFTRCYVPTPQCAPSRACVLTGQYPHTHGITTNGNDKNPMALPAEADTFTARLKNAGYACGIVGKWHLPYATARAPGFGLVDFVATDDNPWQWDNCPVWVQGEKKTADKYLTDWHGDQAVEFVEKFKDGSFFLWLCFRAPHAPLAYPPGTESLYPLDSIDLPAKVDAEALGWPPKLKDSDPAKAVHEKKDADLREARAKYYAMITRIDENVGRVLKRVDELGLRERTVIVFACDNGWMLGEQQLFGKGPFFYEPLIRGPLLIRGPALGKPGLKIPRVVSLVDLAPTLCELAGVSPLPLAQGRSLLAVIGDPETRSHADECFLEYDEQGGRKFPARGIVTTQFKFVDYLEDTDVLFDLSRDPQERRNILASDKDTQAQYASVRKVLENRLNHWRQQTRDPLLKAKR